MQAILTPTMRSLAVVRDKKPCPSRYFRKALAAFDDGLRHAMKRRVQRTRVRHAASGHDVISVRRWTRSNSLVRSGAFKGDAGRASASTLGAS
jgi:hypothetical protein